MSSPIRNLSNKRRSPLPLFRSAERWTVANLKPEVSAYQIKEYLAQYPQILDEFILESVSVEKLEELLQKKKGLNAEETRAGVTKKGPAIKLTTLYSEIGIVELSRRIMESTEDEQIYEKIHEISRVIASTTDADAFKMYVVEESGEDLAVFDPDAKVQLKHVGPTGYGLTVSAHVAVDKRSQNVRDMPQDSRFPKGTGVGDDVVHHVMCVPILLESGNPYAVVEFTRGWERDPFTKNDFELTNAILSWITACMQKMKLNKVLKAQTTLNNYLLDTTKVMFDDIQNIDALVTNIMMFTKDLVHADRCALFLVDEDRHELFADYFDEGRKSETGLPLFTKKSQIRFPQEKGIAGYVASSGEILNIPDAYEDPRFNPDVDKKTGYKTKSILCMPIVSKDGVIGVVQMVNRLKGDHFTDEDEGTFKLFAIYCALALHYSRIYNMLTHQQSKYKVAMEVLQFHMNCNEENLAALVENPYIDPADIPQNFYTFDYCCYDDESKLTQLFIRMVQDCFGNERFEIRKLCSFTLTVRKNYRPVEYHNWQHGFHVAHSLWRMIAAYPDKFTLLEKMSMIVAGIAHDIDHRGYNNEFFKKLKLPLAALYSTSVMEQHHYKQTITILHAEENDIFSFLTADEHKEVLDLIRQHIIATDLALYFGKQKFLAGLIETNTFDYDEPTHREPLLQLMMSGADLCAVSKPWETQIKTTDFLYEEFYRQGDEEKKRGIMPIPMMDRANKDEIPKQQIGFINFICLPLYSTLVALLPDTKPLLEGCKVNKEHWEMVITENKHKSQTLRV